MMHRATIRRTTGFIDFPFELDGIGCSQPRRLQLERAGGPRDRRPPLGTALKNVMLRTRGRAGVARRVCGPLRRAPSLRPAFVQGGDQQRSEGGDDELQGDAQQQHRTEVVEGGAAQQALEHLLAGEPQGLNQRQSCGPCRPGSAAGTGS